MNNTYILKRLWIVVSCALLLGASADFPEFQMEEYEEALEDDDFFVPIPEFIDVPRVSGRLDGVVVQERLPVEAIVIEGVVPYPDKNITQDQIQAVIDRRFRSEQAIERDENGFTKRDLDDIGAFLREITDRPGNPDEDDLRELVEMIKTQEIKRGWITIEQLDAIALEVTEYYRENGFSLHL